MYTLKSKCWFYVCVQKYAHKNKVKRKRARQRDIKNIRRINSYVYEMREEGKQLNLLTWAKHVINNNEKMRIIDNNDFGFMISKLFSFFTHWKSNRNWSLKKIVDIFKYLTMKMVEWQLNWNKQVRMCVSIYVCVVVHYKIVSSFYN